MGLKTWHVLQSIPLEIAIERTFRFLEMIIIATLLAVVIAVVDDRGSNLARIIFSLAAGLYVGIPLTRWLASQGFPGSAKVPDPFVQIALCLLMTTAAIAMTMSLQDLVGATFQIDKAVARKAYYDRIERSEMATCRWPGVYCPEVEDRQGRPLPPEKRRPLVDRPE